MTRRPALIVALALGLAACGDPETAVQWSRVQTEFDQAVDELGDLGSEVGGLLAIQASRLGEAVDGKLDDLDAHLGDLSLAMEGASEVARERYDEAMKVVAMKRTLLELRLEELGESSGAAAEELRQGVVSAYDDLVVSMQAAREAWRETAPDAGTTPVSGEVR